jgi:hypothetical protein
MGLIWSDVVRATTLGPAVFEVAQDHRRSVRDWLAAQDLPRAAHRDVHSPTVEGWALLDGGVTAVSGYGLTSLPHGLRVLGFGALRLLLDGLGIDGPEEPFPDERPVDLDELRRRHRATARDSPQVREQADLLTVCRDDVLLRWVATTLFREARAAPAAPDAPTEPTAIEEPPARRPHESTVEMRAIDPSELVSAERTPPGGSRL